MPRLGRRPNGQDDLWVVVGIGGKGGGSRRQPPAPDDLLDGVERIDVLAVPGLGLFEPALCLGLAAAQEIEQRIHDRRDRTGGKVTLGRASHNLRPSGRRAYKKGKAELAEHMDDAILRDRDVNPGVLSRYGTVVRDLAAWKSAAAWSTDGDYCIVELTIPVGSRVHLPESLWNAHYVAVPDAYGNCFDKYRSDQAFVVRIDCVAGGRSRPFPYASSFHDPRFFYYPRETVRPRGRPFYASAPKGDTTCAEGIHWFLSRDEAERWARALRQTK